MVPSPQQAPVETRMSPVWVDSVCAQLLTPRTGCGTVQPELDPHPLQSIEQGRLDMRQVNVTRAYMSSCAIGRLTIRPVQRLGPPFPLR